LVSILYGNYVAYLLIEKDKIPLKLNAESSNFKSSKKERIDLINHTTTRWMWLRFLFTKKKDLTVRKKTKIISV
jgi:hypothetical protein